MVLLVKQFQMFVVLFLCVQFFNTFLTADALAQTSVDDLRKKGQQCIDWQNSAEIADRLDLVGCLNSCARFAEMAANDPNLLAEDRINTCNEVYAALEREISGEPLAPEEFEQAPETIEEMVKDMNKKEQECKMKAENAKTPVEKRSAESCYNTCYRGALKISKGGVPVEQAKNNWKMCVGVK